MKTRGCRRRAGLALSLVLSLHGVSGVVAAEEPLHVLLTNDDGYGAPGIQAMWRGLDDAGYRVSVVAPASQQRASSVRTSSDPFPGDVGAHL